MLALVSETQALSDQAVRRRVPFSMDTLSVGSPDIVHARVLIGSSSVLIMLVPSVQGTSSSFNFATHSDTSCVLQHNSSAVSLECYILTWYLLLANGGLQVALSA